MSNSSLCRVLDPARGEQPTLNPNAAQSPPIDPLELMVTAARAHWRAAAWLLERTRPEEFGRKSASAAPRRQVEAALLHVLEAALAATPPDQRQAVDGPVFAACQRAFASCFPAIAALAPFKPPAAEAILSPKTHEATTRVGDEELNHDGTTSTTEDAADEHLWEASPTPIAFAAAGRRESAAQLRGHSPLPQTLNAQPPAEIVSPKIAAATECPAPELPPAVESLPEAPPESQLLSLQRHAILRRREQQQSRKRQAAAKRQQKAAKKQARAARRRAA